MSKEEAVKLIEECMRVMFMRDKKACENIQISTVTHADGVSIGAPYKIEASLDLPQMYTMNNEFYRPLRIRY